MTGYGDRMVGRMRRQAHMALGILAFLAYTYPLMLLLTIPASMILIGFFAVLSGSVLPDRIEPADHWRHRGPGHSRRAMRLSAAFFAVTALLGFFQAVIPVLSVCYVISGFFLGYSLHLLADSLTPADLPE